MKKTLFYFYIVCFIALIVVGVIDIFAQEGYFFSMILVQLVWGPVAIIHCFFKFLTTRNLEGRIPKLYTTSLVLTLIYFAIFALLSSLSNITLDENLLVILGLMVIPWSLLFFFTSIQYLEFKEHN